MPVFLLAAPVAAIGAIGGAPQVANTISSPNAPKDKKEPQNRENEEMHSEPQPAPSLFERLFNRALQRQSTAASQFTMS